MPSRSRTSFARIEDLAWSQGGLVTARQLAEVAVPSSTVRYRIRSGGPWQRVLPTVYQVFHGALTPAQREQAAVLYAGPDAVLTGLSALRRHGLRYLPSNPLDSAVHVLVPHARRPRSVGFVLVERTERLPASMRGSALPTSPLVRAVVDASRRCTDRRAVRALASEVVQSGRASVADLADELATSQRRGSALLREVLTDLASGTRSAPEAELRDAVLAWGLPEPLWNPTLSTRDGRIVFVPDGYYPEAGVALEVNSHEYHGYGEAFEATEKRQASLAGLGILVVPITPNRLRLDAPGVMRDIDATLRAASGRPRPDVRIENDYGARRPG